MMCWRRVIILMLCAFFVSSGTVEADGAEKDARRYHLGSATYVDAAVTEYYRFDDGKRTSAPIMPKSGWPKVGSTKEDISTAAVIDCSNANYVCTREFFHIFAVPRGKLSPTAIYTVAGARLEVLRCLRETSGTCQVALIMSECQIPTNEGFACKIAGKGMVDEDKSGPTTYFIYNVDYGVTAFYYTPFKAASVDEAWELADQFRLRGETGLLHQRR